ncbi:GH3 auxin-responsive promoter family protein [Sungkyunkwania multivorans]|uniref:GH3 auxin-responsive promoter family protein n=1 Tax=Sungkyunkwania multivorans TaxID=1173618 RepID=A0ABW3CUU1_9FLAO
MPILGSILKSAIDLKNTIESSGEAIEEQKDVLVQLLETAKHTDFGKQYDFEAILASDDILDTFRRVVPYFDYHQLHDSWWHKIIDGSENVTWPGAPSYLALSSGTTGKESKRIPVTDAMLTSIKAAGIKQVTAISNFDLPASFFEKGILMLGSSTNLEENEEFLEGEISGISASNIPYWFQTYYKPGEEIAQIDSWDERVLAIAKRAKDWDIGALSGIPSWIELMLEKVIEYNKLKTIHDIWPNLQVYTSGGVAFQPYAKSFEKLFGKHVHIIDTYLASEGFIAYQERPETDAMKLITDNGIFFEFIPFQPEYVNQDGSIAQDAPSLTIDQVTTDTDYILIISTNAGAWRYLIGDTIEFSDVERAEIRITGRTKFFLNVVGSQLSVQKMNAALKEMEKKFDIEIPEFTLSATRINDEFHHHWYLGTDADMDNEALASTLDEILKDANKNYKVARSKALKGIKVSTVDPKIFAEWSGKQKKKGGQVKMELVMSEDKFAEWEAFVEEQNQIS